MAERVARGRLKRTKTGRQGAIFSMFVAETVAPFRWDSPVVYLNNEQKATILFTSLRSRVRFPQWPDSHSEYSARLMFNFRILFWSVVRFRPRRSAAPPL